jgi:hypothetical protein
LATFGLFIVFFDVFHDRRLKVFTLGNIPVRKRFRVS